MEDGDALWRGNLATILSWLIIIVGLWRLPLRDYNFSSFTGFKLQASRTVSSILKATQSGHSYACLLPPTNVSLIGRFYSGHVSSGLRLEITETFLKYLLCVSDNVSRL